VRHVFLHTLLWSSCASATFTFFPIQNSSSIAHCTIFNVSLWYRIDGGCQVKCVGLLSHNRVAETVKDTGFVVERPALLTTPGALIPLVSLRLPWPSGYLDEIRGTRYKIKCEKELMQQAALDVASDSEIIFGKRVKRDASTPT
jgi:hypothetical protein